MTKDEPVGVVYSMQDGYIGQMLVKDIPHKTKLYTHPHQWQGLTDDEIDNARYNWERQYDYKHTREIQLLLADFGRAIEQTLKEKNCENYNPR
jgi:hypothetical protein